MKRTFFLVETEATAVLNLPSWGFTPHLHHTAAAYFSQSTEWDFNVSPNHRPGHVHLLLLLLFFCLLYSAEMHLPSCGLYSCWQMDISYQRELKLYQMFSCHAFIGNIAKHLASKISSNAKQSSSSTFQSITGMITRFSGLQQPGSIGCPFKTLQ